MKVHVVIDVEMCGVKTRNRKFRCKNEIIQIGEVMMDESFVITDTFSTYVRPRYGRIDHMIKALTGITERNTGKAPDIEEALEAMLTWIGPDESVFYSWSLTDYYQIRREFQWKCREDSIWEVLLNQSNWIDYQEQFGRRLKTTACMKLTEALELVELDVHRYLHNGLDDACNTARMIAKLETNRDYRTLIERVREKEREQTPLTVSLGSFLQGLDLEPA